jgi:mono/diheme cytochrome c family protein
MQGQRSIRDGVYSDAQAARGSRIFETRCSICHPREQFIGPFLQIWDGRSIHSLFEVIRQTMPEENPGSLGRQQYVDVLTYFLKMNRAPAGSEELGDTDSVLKAVLIEGPFDRGGLVPAAELAVRDP